MIVSFCPGRIRLRFKELKNPAVAEAASARIKAQPGVIGVAVNPRTGSLLVEYDTAALPTEMLFAIGAKELAKLGIKLELPAEKP